MTSSSSSGESVHRSAWSAFFAALTLRSVGWAVGGALVVTALVAPIFMPPWPVLLARTLFVATAVLLAYTAAGQWHSARWPRWLLQVIAVAVAGPVATFVVYLVSTGGDVYELLGNEARITGLVLIGGGALVLGLIIGLGALVRERDAQANAQALSFTLERERLQRQAADAQLAVLRSQVEPHFLFNTLANVQALVESGSPRAAPVLASLIAYLRASMPRLGGGSPTLGEEAALVRAYLELMQMRMPDRMAFRIDVDPSLASLRLPPLTLLTLVENAVRHGIDPCEEGGSIEVGARREADGAVRLWVADTGRGLDETHAPGTGLANLRQRLASVYATGASLELHAVEPHGVRAEIRLVSP